MDEAQSQMCAVCAKRDLQGEDDFKDVALKLIRDAADNRMQRLNGEDKTL